MDPYESTPEDRAAAVAGCRAAHDRLLADLDGLTEDEVREPSALPGWSVAHVLSHLARNAEAHVGMAAGVAAGEVRRMYPSPAARDEGIERGAALGLDRLVADVRDSAAALHAAWSALTADQWETGAGLTSSGPIPMAFLPMMRWREVELHHADLGRAFGWEDWSEAYVRADLPQLLALLARDADRLDVADARRLVAVLSGRLREPVTVPTVLD